MHLTVPPGRSLRGQLAVPGDKSLAHRALLYGALRHGTTTVAGLGAGADVAATAQALRTLGVQVQAGGGQGGMVVEGAGFAGLESSGARIDCGNSGTSLRLLAGVLAGRPGPAVLDGDASLRRRPMERVAAPLRRLGAQVATTAGHPPVTVAGGHLGGRSFRLQVASAQVKSALLLAGLQADGRTTVTEPGPSRDHTERALRRLGLPVGVDGPSVWVDGPVADLGTGPLAVRVPGDPSSAAFLLGAALVVPGSDVRIDGLCLNSGRIGAFEVWRAMGADLSWRVEGEDELGEPIGWAQARHSTLGAGRLAGDDLVRAVDEVPILVATAAAAGARLEVADAEELRVKESDRLATMGAGLRALGARVDEYPGGLMVDGGGRLRGAQVDAAGDHRVAMALFVAGLATDGEVVVHGWDGVASSYPEFLGDLARLGLESQEVPA